MQFWQNIPEFWLGVIASITATAIVSSTLYMSGVAGKAAKDLKEKKIQYMKNLADGVLSDDTRNAVLLQSYTTIAVNFALSMWQILLAIFMQKFIGMLSFTFFLLGFYYFMKASSSLNMLRIILEELPDTRTKNDC